MESNLSSKDKQYSYYFEKHRNVILSNISKEVYDLVDNELNKLQENVVKSLMYFNRKYYMAGFMDTKEILLKT